MGTRRLAVALMTALFVAGACTPPPPTTEWATQELDGLPSYAKAMSGPSDTEGGSVYSTPAFGTAVDSDDFPVGAQLIVDVDIAGLLSVSFDPDEQFILDDLQQNGLTMCTRLVAETQPGFDQLPLTEWCTPVPLAVLDGGGPNGYTPYEGSVTLGPVPLPGGINAYGVQTKLEIPYCYDIDGCTALASTTAVTVRWPL